MEGNLVFCTDGTLRFHSESDDRTALPLTSIQQVHGNNPYFLLKYFYYAVDIESGTTLRNIITSLEPWAELLSEYLDVDIKSYIEAVRKPSLLNTPEYDWIGISRETSLYRQTIVSNDDEINFRKTGNVNEFLKSKVFITPEFSLDYGFCAQAYKIGEETPYEISINVERIKNIPVIIHQKEAIHILLHEDEEQQLPNNILGLYEHESNRFVTANIDCILFQEFIHALFVNGLHYNDASVADESEKILSDTVETLVEITEELIKESSKPNLTIVGESQAEQTNEKTIYIDISSGPLYDLLKYNEHIKQEWEILKNKVSKIDKPFHNIRLGRIRYAHPPEIRLYNLTFTKHGDLTQNKNT